jgi:dipeptidyl aminopeptidase/acylaminoacyl peptidase
MRRLTAAAFACAAALLAPYDAAAAGGKRAFEIRDHYRVAGVGAPALSPDGSRVAVSVRRWDLDAGETWAEIWTLAADGSGLRQMTFSRAGARHADTAPLFSPDGETLLFASDRDGEGQLWAMAVDGGEPRRLTDHPAGVSDPVYSPDGKHLAVTAEVYPECGADADCHERIATAVEEGELEVHLADELLYRHWTAWRDGRYRHVLLLDAATGKVLRDLTPGRWDSPTFSVSGGRGYDFSPDGRDLVYVSNHDRDQASSTNSDLWRVPVAGPVDETTAVNLTAANPAWDGAPLHSPDGRSIAFLSQAVPGHEADLFRLSLLDRVTGAVRHLTDRASFPDWVDEMAWLPDGSGLLFQAEVGGRTPLYRADLAGGAPRLVLTHGLLDGWELSADGSTVVYTRRTVGEPAEVFRAAAAPGPVPPARLTRFNADLEAEVDVRPAEELWVRGDGDYDVQVFVVKPHGFDPAKKYPVILNVHGGPQQQWVDAYRADWQVYPGKGYVVAFPNPTGSPGRGQDFVDAISCDWGGRVYRDLMKVTDALAALPYVDSTKMGAMGWSYGGYMMMWFAGHTDRFQALASMMGVYDLPAMYGATEELWFPEQDLCGRPWDSEHYRRWNPADFVPNFKTPTLVLTGEKDYRVPYTQSLEFFTALQKRGVPSRLIVFPRSGHWPGWQEMAFYYNAHLDWFQRWLGGGAAPWDVLQHSRNLAFGPAAKGTDDGAGEPKP